MPEALRPYEVMIILDADLDEEVIREAVERWLTLIESGGAERGHVSEAHGGVGALPGLEVHAEASGARRGMLAHLLDADVEHRVGIGARNDPERRVR